MEVNREHSFSFNYVCLAPDEQIGLHRQPSWELSYVVNGAGKRLIEGTEESFRRGEVVMLPPEVAHQWIFDRSDTDSDGRISNITVAFTDGFLDGCSSAFPELRPCVERLKRVRFAVKFGGRNAAAIVSILKSMCCQGDVERLASLIRLLPLLSGTEALRVLGERRSTGKEEARLEKIRTYIVCNASRGVSLDDAARHVGMGKSSFCAFFRCATGRTLTAYLNEYRVEQTCRLLRREEVLVSEVCYRVGFADVPHFNRVFKRLMGCSPSRFRTLCRAEAGSAEKAP